MERLDKLISVRANLTRKEAKALIKSGHVRVNGTAVPSPERKISDVDMVSIDGRELGAEKCVYYMMNKPAGVISATEDKNCETVLGLLPEELKRRGLFPAGRLDKDTEGFVLITDDGDFAHRVLAPKNHVPKTYFVRLDGKIPALLPELFALGVDIGGGDVTSPAELRILKNGENGSEAELVIYEGMYHQVKRMFKKFSLNVVYLKRIKIGGLPIDADLPVGSVRKILHKELMLILD